MDSKGQKNHTYNRENIFGQSFLIKWGSNFNIKNYLLYCTCSQLKKYSQTTVKKYNMEKNK